jgi:hypothetical protein
MSIGIAVAVALAADAACACATGAAGGMELTAAYALMPAAQMIATRMIALRRDEMIDFTNRFLSQISLHGIHQRGAAFRYQHTWVCVEGQPALYAMTDRFA